ncbi:MAG: hypothetical protein Q4G10_03345 [Bacteroidia bacterium]|nr:hypothetical protein [Bacteroidia bacterium]
MNKKTLVIYIAVALVFLAGIAAGVSLLYKGDSDKPAQMSKSSAVERFPLLQAVPSDAAAIFCSGSLKDGASLLTDGSKAFSALVFDDKRDAYGHFFSTVLQELDGGSMASLKSMPMAVSLHYSGSIVPLVVASVPKGSNDSTAVVAALAEAARAAGMKSSFYSSGNIAAVLVSISETIVNSSVRHQEEGQSILSSKDFIPALAGAEGKDVLLFSNAYSSKLLPVYFQRPVTRHSEFIKSISTWTVMSVTASDEKALSIKGYLPSDKDGDHFVDVFSDVEPENGSFSSVVPSETYFAVSLPLADQGLYLIAYRNYLDAESRLGSNRGNINKLGKSAGKNPDDWAKALSLKEVVKAQWRAGDDIFEALFARVGKKDYSLILNGLEAENEKDYSMAPAPYSYSGFLSALFGGFFSVADESSFLFTGEWIVSGSEKALADYVERYSAGDFLQALLADATVVPASLNKDCSMAAYFSVGASPSESIFSASALLSVTKTLDGAAYEPCFLFCNGNTFKLDVIRVPFIEKASTPAVVTDAVIDVPQGPFKVKNSGTGATNLLAQRENYYLSLLEEDGKGIWSVPFSEPLCGAVESIDYYANGKLQFLFAAGSKLYLLDRLGRFVSGFPSELGKPVLLGPSAYDFSGAGGYSVMVLHNDNTIGMYNIHGVKPEKWQGITSDETIIALPELLKVGGSSYWAVRTAVQTQIFPFYGGEPVYRQEGAKSIRRDSNLEIEGDSIKVVCNDGKTRNIKLKDGV